MFIVYQFVVLLAYLVNQALLDLFEQIVRLVLDLNLVRDPVHQRLLCLRIAIAVLVRIADEASDGSVDLVPKQANITRLLVASLLLDGLEELPALLHPLLERLKVYLLRLA